MQQNDFLKHVVQTLEDLDIPYAIVGSFASSVHGEPRFTNDIDVVFDLQERDVVAFCERFPPPDYYVNESTDRDAIKRRKQFNIIHPESGNKVDCIVIQLDEWGKNQLHRRERVQVIPNLLAYVASPEDVIVAKMKFYLEGRSEKHLRDISGILRVAEENIDREYILRFASQFKTVEIWEAILDRLKLDDQ